jgi:Gram-negative bacterial TonB protein C-terminal
MGGFPVYQDLTNGSIPPGPQTLTGHTLVAEDTVEKSGLIFLLCMFAVPCLSQTQLAICPKHIESPTYPLLARQTRLMGDVTLSVTIDADGRVQHVTALPETQSDKPINCCEIQQSRTYSTGRLANRRRHPTPK